MGIYVGAGGVKTVNSLYVGAGGVKTVTAVYVGAGGTYKVWPDIYGLEDNAVLNTTGYFGAWENSTSTSSSVTRQTASSSQTNATHNTFHYFSTSKPINLSEWNYLCFGLSVWHSTTNPSYSFWVTGMVGFATAQNTNSLYYSSSTFNDNKEYFNTSKSCYYIRATNEETSLEGYTDGYMFVKCDISACNQTSVYLQCGAMLGGGGGYRYLALLDGYGPYLYRNSADCTLSAPDGHTTSYTLTMTSTSNTTILSSS